MRHEDLCVLKKVCPLRYFSARVTSPMPVASGRACKLLHTLQWCLHIHSVRWSPIALHCSLSALSAARCYFQLPGWCVLCKLLPITNTCHTTLSHSLCCASLNVCLLPCAADPLTLRGLAISCAALRMRLIAHVLVTCCSSATRYC